MGSYVAHAERENRHVTLETRSAFIDALADEVRKRREQCPILLAVQVLSAANAVGLSQAEIDEAFRRADVDA